MSGTRALDKTLPEPFETKYFADDNYRRQCKDSGGRCGFNTTSTKVFVCYCRDRPHLIKCEPGGKGFSLGVKLAIGMIPLTNFLPFPFSLLS
ncbi:hypothetical protein POUND7_006221 [Theobroma cacao]